MHFPVKQQYATYSSGVFTPYLQSWKYFNTYYCNTVIWLLPIFGVLGFSSDITFSCSFHQFLSNKYQFWDLSWMFDVSLFHLCSLDLLLQNKGVLSFRAGSSQEVNQEVSLILHLMKRMTAALKVGEKYFPSCRDNWATSVISICEWQKGINFCFCLVYFCFGVSVRYDSCLKNYVRC